MDAHYTYLITRNTLDDPMFYIGVRSCKCLPEEDDGYMGSSKVLAADIQQQGHVLFSKKIIQVFPTRRDAIEHEVELHDLYEVARAPHFYNRTKQKTTGFSNAGVLHTPETKLKVANSLRGRSRDPETIAKVQATKRKNGSTGKGVPKPPFTDEHRAKMSAARKGKAPPPMTEEGRARLIASKKGSKHSIEAKEKMAAAKRGKRLSPEHRAKISETLKKKGSMTQCPDLKSI